MHLVSVPSGSHQRSKPDCPIVVFLHVREVMCSSIDRIARKESNPRARHATILLHCYIICFFFFFGFCAHIMYTEYLGIFGQSFFWVEDILKKKLIYYIDICFQGMYYIDINLYIFNKINQVFDFHMQILAIKFRRISLIQFGVKLSYFLINLYTLLFIFYGVPGYRRAT